MIIWVIVIALLVGVDQITKALVVANLDPVSLMTPVIGRSSIEVIRNFFYFTHIRNDNMVFGMDIIGNIFGVDNDHKYIVYLAVMGIAIILFIIMFIRIDFKNKKLFWYTLAMALLISGALGNAIDRLFQYDHNVVDFIDFSGIWQYVFNMADVYLNVGIALFIFDQFILEPKRKKQASG